jgi:hypothetical protein
MARAYPVEIHDHRKSFVNYFNLNLHCKAFSKKLQQTKYKANKALKNGWKAYIKLEDIATCRKFWSSSNIPCDIKPFVVYGAHDYDNHDKVDKVIWAKDKVKFKSFFNIPDTFEVESVSGYGDHQPFLINVGEGDWYVGRGDYAEVMNRTEMGKLISHVIHIRKLISHLVCKQLQSFGKLSKMFSYDCMGKPAIYIKDRDGDWQISKMGDLTFMSPQLYNMTEAEWDANLLHYTLQEFIDETQNIIDNCKISKSLINKIKEFANSPFVIHSNIIKLPAAKLAEKSGSNPFVFPEKLCIEIGKHYNHDWIAMQTAVQPYRITRSVDRKVLKTGVKFYEKEQKHVISEKRFKVIATAFLYCTRRSEKNHGDYKNTVPREFVRSVIKSWEHVDCKNASNEEIGLIETFLVRWGLIEVVSKDYVFGSNGIACKYKTVSKEALSVPFVTLENTTKGLFNYVLWFRSKYYVRKYGRWSGEKSLAG